MKVFRIYYETENGVEITRVLAKSRRSLTLPVETKAVIKIVDITDEFTNELKGDVKVITEKISEDIVEDIVLVLQAIKLY